MTTTTQPVAPDAVAPSTPQAMARAAFHLLGVTLRRQFFSPQTLIGLALTIVCGLIVVAWSFHRDPTTKRLAQHVLVPSFIAFLMPVLAIGYGAADRSGARRPDADLSADDSVAAAGDLSGAIPRGAGARRRHDGGVPVDAVHTGRCAGRRRLDAVLAGKSAGGAAYAALFLLVGAVFRHGTIISLAYWFFLEVLFGNMPGIIKRVSVAFYVRSTIYEAGADLEIGPASRTAREMFLPVTADTAGLCCWWRRPSCSYWGSPRLLVRVPGCELTGGVRSWECGVGSRSGSYLTGSEPIMSRGSVTYALLTPHSKQRCHRFAAVTRTGRPVRS